LSWLVFLKNCLLLEYNCIPLIYKGFDMSILAELFTSRTRAEFFRIFFGTNSKGIHLREIERQSGLTIGTIKKEAEKLVGLDLLLKRIDGNRSYFQANTNHPLYSTIRELVSKTSGIEAILKETFEGQDVKFVFIFGSIATGKEKSDSDVDIFVIGNLGLRKTCEVINKPAFKIGREINPHVMKLEEFRKRQSDKEHFVTRVLESPIRMIIGKEDELRNLG
jgi:predicted nucleotidyltransferase